MTRCLEETVQAKTAASAGQRPWRENVPEVFEKTVKRPVWQGDSKQTLRSERYCGLIMGDLLNHYYKCFVLHSKLAGKYLKDFEQNDEI